jgi:anti-sigma B factor antagonist
MEFKITTRKADTVLVMDLAGKITAGDALLRLREAIRDEVAKGNHRILLNLKNVSYVDSSGLGELIMALGTVTQTICASCGATVFKDEDGNWDVCPQCESNERTAWGDLKLSNAGRQVKDLLEFTKLSSVFDVHESEQEALAAFQVRRVSGSG